MKPSINVVFACLFFSICAHAQDGSPRTISVTGEASVQVVPDQVILSVGIESVNRNFSIAREENDRAIKKVLSAMRGLDIPERNLKTDYINIDTDVRRKNCNDGDNGKCEVIVIYSVRRSLTIDLRDVSKFDKALTAALDAGATHIQDVQFQTTELRKYRDQARAMAIRAAREKADLLVREAGSAITDVISISEGSGYGGPSFYGRWWGRGGSYMTQNAMNIAPASSEAGSSESFAPGQLAVTASVSVVYSLK